MKWIKVILGAFLVVLFACKVYSAPKFEGFDFALTQGTYWEFYWTYKHTSVVQGEGTNTDVDTGNFRVSLGPSKTIQGITSYQVLVSGDSEDPKHDYAPRWKYIAVNNNQILGSIDGVFLETIFDANIGEWNGGGFFTTFSSERLMTASSGQVDNEFVETSAIVVRRSASQSFCETINGYFICPNDDQFTVNEREYYKGGLGPLAYYSYIGYSSSGGGFYTSFTYTRHLGLVDTSLEAYDGFEPKLPLWTKKTDMPTPRHDHSTAVLGGKIYVIGGSNWNSVGPRHSSVDIYNPSTDSWYRGTPMPEGRSGHISVAFNGKIYVVGGFIEKPLGSQVIYPPTLEYDPSIDSWTKKAPFLMKEEIVTGDAALGYIWVFPDDNTYVFAYEILSDTWWYVTSRLPREYIRNTVSALSSKSM